MRFRYRKIAPGIIRPIIPIGVKYRKLTVPYEVLIDSGADFCIFHAEIAEILGIPFRKGKRDQLAGITGDKVPMSLYPITISVGGWKYKIEAGFTKYMGQYGYGVVGQKGFFEYFAVKFDYQKGIIDIKPKTKSK